MKINNLICHVSGVISLFAAFIISGCGGEAVKQEFDIPQDEIKVSEKTNIFKVDNKLFYMPNPAQTAMLIKKISSGYNKEMLNQIENAKKYETSFKQAINVGIYGTDLGYISSIGQNQDATKYLAALKQLTDGLGVSPAFNFANFTGNTTNQDEMLKLITSAYRDCQTFLRDNDRNEIASLLLAGAWIEGLYFSITLAKESKNEEVIRRIGEQKKSLDNIILILNPYYNQETSKELSEFVDGLVVLQVTYQQVYNKYTFEKSTCDEPSKKCIINSKNDIIMSEEVLRQITKKTEEIRNKLIS